MVSVAEVSAPGLVEDLAEHVDGFPARWRLVGGVGVRVVAGVDVELVGVAAAGRGDVQDFSSGGRGDVGVGGVDGAALGAVGCGRIPEVDMVTDIVGGRVTCPWVDPARPCG